MTTAKKTVRRRCSWANGDALYESYHDTEWCVPLHDSRALWELLMLEGFQAGLAWIIVLKKRAAQERSHQYGYRRCDR